MASDRGHVRKPLKFKGEQINEETYAKIVFLLRDIHNHFDYTMVGELANDANEILKDLGEEGFE